VRRAHRADGKPPALHAHGGVVGEADQVDGAGQVGPLDRVAMGHFEHPVTEQADPRRPVVLVERSGHVGGGGVVVPGNDGRQAEDGGDGEAGFLQADRGFGEGQVHRLVDNGHLLAVVVPGRPAASAVGGPGVVVGLVDRLPTADQVSERLGYEVDVSPPHLCSILLEEESAGVEEPPGKGEVMERDPWHDAGNSRRLEDVAVVLDRPFVVGALVGLEAGPLHRQAVVGQAQGGQVPEVLGVARGEPVPVSGHRNMTGPLPLPPVRGRGCTLALGGGSTRSPPEAFRPTHAHEYGKKGGAPTEESPYGAGQGAPGAEGDGGEAFGDPFIACLVGVKIVRKITGIGRAEQVQPAPVMEVLVTEAAPHLDDRFDR